MLGDYFAQVLSSAQAGEDRGFAAIYHDLAPTVRGFAVGRGSADSDDIVSETMTSVARSINGFVGDEGAFRSWVFTIAYRRLVDERRRRSRRVETVPLAPGHEGAGGDWPEDEALRAVSDGPMARALAQLSQDQRDVVLLRVVAGLAVREVAQAVGKRESAVKMLTQRGLARLEELLRADVTFEPRPDDGQG